ncbi:MAG: undecaprenyl-diphosphate phosphatase [Planctomycetota bacterium]|jgi:undecaprenyl-diphosphatase|nr:undecaprenyl-diphosphate phosphatase [Planctomycetota bacterium]
MDGGTDAFNLGYFWAAALGILQGATEFLPVSSSGHLALAEHLGLGREAPPAFDLLLHLATLAVVGRYFRRDLARLLREGDFRPVLLVAIASLPAAAAGLAFKGELTALRRSPAMICLGLLVTAGALAATELARRNAAGLWRGLSRFEAFAIGLCQALALAPGVSRSGLTLSGALLCRTGRDEAFRFSFIMSIPIILGAAGLHFLEIMVRDGPGGLVRGVGIGPLAVGLAAAGLSGHFALSLLERLAGNGRLPWFAGYCGLAGTAGLLYF